MASAYDRLQRAAAKFDNEHPRVWQLFIRFADSKRIGGRQTGAKAVMERVRWETDAGDTDRDGFKINNSVTSFYARWYNRRHPGYFRVREQTSKRHAA